MAHVVLFHSGLGLTSHVRAWAADIEARGHRVVTPDLYEGEVFDDYDAGVAHRDSLGIETLIGRAMAAVDGLPEDLVYAGFSMGTGAAELLAFTRPGARGLLLMHGGLPPEAIGVDAWPGQLRVQAHWAREDAWVEPGALDALAAMAPAGRFEGFEYEGSAHLFGFEGHPDHVAGHARLMRERTLAFLASFDG